ncbi:MAG TPA: pantetheine-phosphate adenylyltransferase [Thermoleophilia bacterium]|nr:pantetheine-phosphate adenylyltransferase [Thermoleophilia bacterium]
MNVALCPGTYDPVTVGHLDVITRVAAMFDEVVVAVVDDSFRKSVLFTSADRIHFLEVSTAHLSNVRVVLMKALVVTLAREVGAHVLVKGLRAFTDFEYEFQMAQLNRKLDPDLETMYLMASPEYSFLSSSGVKEIARYGGCVGDLVPEIVADRFAEMYGSAEA